jgi:hypothetical protein
LWVPALVEIDTKKRVVFREDKAHPVEAVLLESCDRLIESPPALGFVGACIPATQRVLGDLSDPAFVAWLGLPTHPLRQCAQIWRHVLEFRLQEPGMRIANVFHRS